MLVVLICSLGTLAHGFSLLSPWHVAMPREAGDVIINDDDVIEVDDVVVKDDVVITTFVNDDVAVNMFVVPLPIDGAAVEQLVDVCWVGTGGTGDINTGGCVGKGYWRPLAAGKAVPEKNRIRILKQKLKND